MKYFSPAENAEFDRLWNAGVSVREIAAAFGVSYAAARSRAGRRRLPVHKNANCELGIKRSLHASPDDGGLAKRWAAMLPDMKAAVRASAA